MINVMAILLGVCAGLPAKDRLVCKSDMVTCLQEVVTENTKQDSKEVINCINKVKEKLHAEVRASN